MALTEQQFDAWWKENGIESSTFAEKSAARKGWNAAISALPKLEPAEDFICRFRRHVGGDGEFWLHELEDFYTEPPIAPPASAPSEQKQPWPNHNWCVGCSPDNCSGCGTEPIERRAPQPEQENYKAQRDALLDFADHIATAPQLSGTGWQEMAQMVVASVKGGAR